jgi:protein-arginine kinase activator protein McsA
MLPEEALQYAKWVKGYELSRRAEIEQPLLARIKELEEELDSACKILRLQDAAVIRNSITLLNSFGFSGAEADELIKGL